jgi:hypothetical protein
MHPSHSIVRLLDCATVSGIYAHPNGDRFEGTFFNNKPDGLGSFYAYDINSKVYMEYSLQLTIVYVVAMLTD